MAEVALVSGGFEYNKQIFSLGWLVCPGERFLNTFSDLKKLVKFMKPVPM